MERNKFFSFAAIVLIIFIVLSIVPGCCFDIGNIFRKKTVETKANRQSDMIAESVDANLVDINTDFALALFKGLSGEDANSNVFISPLSITLIMAMAYNGAENSTRSEISDILQFGIYTDEQLNSAFQTLLASMENIDDMVELYTGNSIWVRNEFGIEKNYGDIVKNYYNASIYNEDFNDPDTAAMINTWVSEATKGRISNIITSGAIKDLVMCLINAIYFKGQWKDKFKPENTDEQDFYLIDKSVKKVQMMHNSKKYYYFKGADFKMLRVPYGRDKTAMYVILPDENININEFIEDLNTGMVDECIENLMEVEVMFEFPKFNIEYSSGNLIGTLRDLGIKEAFIEDKADFSRISKQLFISRIDHKAIIEVNEEGTVAAAASFIGMGATAVLPVEFIVDRPFILFIRDDRTRNILFAGKILAP